MSENETDTVADAPAEPASKPLLRVVKGDPTAEELAALIAVVAARSAGGAAPKKLIPAPSTSN